MQRWLVLVLLMGVNLVSRSAHAQSALSLATLHVQFLPEYDQPSMLVIYDFEVPNGTKLPVGISIRFPKGANLTAVATQGKNGTLVDTDYAGPTVSGDWQTITVQVQTQTGYHVEYYEPLSMSGQLRQFAFQWPGDYAIGDLRVDVRVPADTTNITTMPAMQSTQAPDGSAVLSKDFGAVTAGQPFPLQVTYTKTSNNLGVGQPKPQPSQPLGPNTQGRVMLSNYVPYIFGVLGAVLIIGGGLFLWQWRREQAEPGGRHRHRAAGAESRGSAEDVYCHQCGTRAQPDDRFCRICGTRLRLPGP
jgi:hypothetical protein